MKSLVTIEFSKQIRIKTLEMIYKAKASHIGGAFSMADILAVLYNDILKYNVNNSKDRFRDRFFLSKGHSCTSLYSTLGLKGFFPIDLLQTYGENGSKLLSHTSHNIAGVELSTGSLGHAFPVSLGVAIAAKRNKMSFSIFCLLSDGELDEGSNWESFLSAPHFNLDNLIVIVDYNKIQSLGRTDEVIPLEPLRSKFESFNWEVFEVDGHNHDKLRETFINAKKLNGKPKIIIANTIKGKGVSFMEDNILWHYKSPSEEQFKLAIAELNK